MTHPDHRPGLDGLRGLACLMVLGYHCALFTGTLAGTGHASGIPRPVLAGIGVLWAGIEIFFVLSGYLLGRMLVPPLVTGRNLDLGRYLKGRALRLLPHYWLALSIATGVAWVGPGGYFPLLFGSADPVEAVRGSWSWWPCLGNYLAPPPAPSPLSWGWSLAVEAQVVIGLPPLLGLVFRLPGPAVRTWALLFGSTLPLLSRLALFLATPGLTMHDVYYATHNRLDGFCLGVLVAYLEAHDPPGFRARVGRARPWLQVGGLAAFAVVAAFGGLQGGTSFHLVWQFSVLAWGSTALLVTLLHPAPAPSAWLAHPAWSPLARLAYGIYLFHPLVLFAVLGLTRPEGVGTGLAVPALTSLFLAVLVVSALPAGAGYLLVEAPFHRKGRALAARPTPDGTA